MKAMLTTISLATLLTLSGCGKGNSFTDSDSAADSALTSTDSTAQTAEANEPTQQEMERIILELAASVQNDGLIETNTTPDFCKLYTQACSSPGTYPGGIGDEESLMLAIGGQDMDPQGKFTKVEFTEFTPEQATCKLTFMNYGQPELHEVTVEAVDGRWLIADWDGLKKTSQEYIALINKLIKGDGAKALLKESGIPADDEFYQDYMDQVQTYKQTYGIK